MSNTITDQQQGSSFGFMRNGGSIANGSTNSDNHSSSFNGSSFRYAASNHVSNNNSRTASTANVPVKYKICFNNQSSAFTVTLLVPVPVPDSNGQLGNGPSQHENDASPFQKVSSAEGAPSFNENGEPIQTYALRIPLPYLVNQSSQEASDADIQKSSAWLDRNTLRKRIDEGGRAIGLDQQQIYHSVAAVEQTASKLPRWCPRSTKTVTVDIILTDKIVTLVANAMHNATSLPPSRKHSIGHYDQGSGSPSQRYYHHSNSSNGIIGSTSQSQSQSSPTSNRSNYNVFNETSGELVATAPSFPPPPGMRSSSIPANLSTSNHNGHIDGNRNIYSNTNGNGSFSAFSPPSKNRNDELSGSNGSRNNNVFNSPLLSSSFGSWGAYPPNNNSSNAADQKQSQPHQQPPQQLNFSNLGPSSLPEPPKANERNIFRMSSEPANPSSFLGQALNGDNASLNPFTYQFDKDIFRNNSEITSNVARTESMNGSHNQVNNSNNNVRPDPSMIVGPLMKMGFNKEECEAAANAIRNISLQSRSVVEMESSLRTESKQDDHHFSQMNGSYLEKVEQQSNADSQTDSSNHQNQGYKEVSASLNTLSLVGNDDKADKGTHQSAPVDELLPKSASNSVWGNAGKLKTIKNPSNENVERTVPRMNDGGNDADTSSSVTTRRDDYSSEDGSSPKQCQQQKMVKVLDIPSDLNAFIFHCNAQTRDECLERGLFGYVVGHDFLFSSTHVYLFSILHSNSNMTQMSVRRPIWSSFQGEEGRLVILG